MSIALRAQITIDLIADDFVCAADHQRRIESLMGAIKDAYGEALLEFRERRPRPARKLRPAREVRAWEGELPVYEEV